MVCSLCGAEAECYPFEDIWACGACCGVEGAPRSAPRGNTILCRTTPTNCWIPEDRGRAEDGRVVIKLDGRKTYLYTAVYESLMGPAPQGLTPDHLCLEPACVNPTHIEWVTREENASRSWTRGKRNQRGAER